MTYSATTSVYINGYDDYWSVFKTGQFRYGILILFCVNNIGSNAFYYALNPFSYQFYYFRSLVPQEYQFNDYKICVSCFINELI